MKLTRKTRSAMALLFAALLAAPACDKSGSGSGSGGTGGQGGTNFMETLPVKPVAFTPASTNAPTGPKAPALASAPLELSGPPVSLTSSDGTGLLITSFKGRSVVEEPLAFTELHLTFKNP